MGGGLGGSKGFFFGVFGFFFQVLKALGGGCFPCKFSPLFGGCLQVLKGLGGGFLCNPPPAFGGGDSLFHLQYKRVGGILGIVIHL